MGQSKLKTIKFGEKRTMEVKCMPCGGFVTAELVTGDVIYPHRPDLKDKMFYRCPHCGGYVGCHPHTINPLGVIPTEEIRKGRLYVHNIIDPLWKKKLIKRGEIYRRLSEAVGHTYHNGECCDIEDLRKAYAEAKRIRDEVFHHKTTVNLPKKPEDGLQCWEYIGKNPSKYYPNF